MATNPLAVWKSGEPCDKHDLAYCASCKVEAGIMVGAGRELYLDNDCAVLAFARVTEVEYDEAADLMIAAGYRPKAGTPLAGIEAAFASAGFATTRTALSLVDAVRVSRTGRRFVVVGLDRRIGAHAWAVVDGGQYGTIPGRWRCCVLEVTA